MTTTTCSKGASKKRAMQANVVVRVRPPLPHEREQPVALRVTKSNHHDRGKGALITMQQDATRGATEFLFDKCYDAATPQRLLFQREVQPAIARVLDGIHTTVFAYGATGTGKTFTMEGSRKNLGMIPRVVRRMFEVVDEQKRTSGFRLDMSYLEIYNDKVLDLLVAKNHQNDLPIRQQADGSVAVQGLTRKSITSVEAFEEVYDRGCANRARAPTDLNPESSRSHSILMIHARCVEPGTGGKETRFGKLHLIDLAGSEDNRRTGNSGVRLAESGKINMSLFVLGKVITALNTGNLQRIPFRDSKLTRLLQDSLGGSSHAVMICNVAETAGLYQECLQTLQYASKVKGIVNEVETNALADPMKTNSTHKTSTIVTAKPEAAKSSQPSASTSQVVGDHRAMKPATGSAPKSSLTSSPLEVDPMESKLLQWRLAKQASQRQSLAGSSSLSLTPTSMKRPSPSPARTVASRLSTGGAVPRTAVNDGTTPADKKPRLSVTPTSAVTSKCTTPASHESICPKPAVKRPLASPVSEKENVSENVVPQPTTKDLTPLGLAKRLISAAIDLEKARRYTAAFCVFKRACHVLPEQNPKLMERLHALEIECPSALLALPSQQLSTVEYMRHVLEMNLLEVLNTGSQDELTSLHLVGGKRAEKIVEARPFSRLSDLLHVHGITDKVLQKLLQHSIEW